MAAEIPQPDPNQPRAEAAGRLVDELNYTQEQVGKVLGKKL